MRFLIKHFRSEEYVIASLHVRLSDKTLAHLGSLRMDEPTFARLEEYVREGARSLSPVYPEGGIEFEEVVKNATFARNKEAG